MMKLAVVIIEEHSLATTYKISPYNNSIFSQSYINTDQIFYSHKILEKKWEYSGMVHKLQTSRNSEAREK